ncbi:UNVERIFIED_CONTAM: hypothetical protein GTU68_040848, partial [Idotea baltica]|nr:hypothetical protein [Idotea baltica]
GGRVLPRLVQDGRPHHHRHPHPRDTARNRRLRHPPQVRIQPLGGCEGTAVHGLDRSRRSSVHPLPWHFGFPRWVPGVYFGLHRRRVSEHCSGDCS